MATEEFIDATIASLKIIGMVPKNGKLCIRKGQLCLDTAVQAQCLRRWANGDSRDATLLHAKSTINNAVKINRCLMSSLIQNDVSAWTIKRLLSEMEQCETGLQNLKTTYVGDSMMIANLEVMIDRQRAHQEEVRKYLESDTSVATTSIGNTSVAATSIGNKELTIDNDNIP
jgi:hypothetical protein